MNEQEEIKFLKQRWYEVEIENWELRSQLEDKQDELDAVRRRNQQLNDDEVSSLQYSIGQHLHGGFVPQSLAIEPRRRDKTERHERFRKAIRESDWK